MIFYENKYMLLDKKVNGYKTLILDGTLHSIIPWNMKRYVACTSKGIPNLPVPEINCDYNTTIYTPRKHQKATTEFLIANPRCFCWNEAGTGKTASCLWAYDYLRQQETIKKILIICPLSITQNVWGTELFKMLTQYDRGILTGAKQRRLNYIGENHSIYVTNHDGIKIMTEELCAWQPDLIIVDEHTGFKNQSTDRFKALRLIAKKAKYVWMLSGTPAPLAPTDIFAPCRIICPDKVGRSFIRFRDLTMRQVSKYRWVPRCNFEDIVKQLGIPVIRFSRDECLDLPNVTTQTFTVEMSKKQKLAYTKLKKDAILLLDGGEVTAVNEGAMRIKLLQCCSGYVYDSAHQIIDLEPQQRLEAIRDIITESSRGVLVFMNFKSSVVAAHKYLSKYFKARIVNGDTTLADRTRHFADFQKEKLKVLVLHPAVAAHGVTLTYANTVIWGLATDRCEWYEQANGRVQRIGQHHKMLIIRLISTPLEKQILSRLEQKQSMQGVLLEVFGKKIGGSA